MALVCLAGCGSATKSQGPLASREPAFRGLPVTARVEPALGGVDTKLRVRFKPREIVGVNGQALRSYEAHLLNRTNPNEAGCIVDTGGFLDLHHPRRGIVLDPSKQMGVHWCRGRFTGVLSYYRAYACPPRGTCHPTSGFRERHQRVARLAFRIR